MPTTVSAKKRLRQNIARRERNRAAKSALKTELRKVREAVKENKLAEAEAEMRVAAKKLDREAARNVIHRNKASRTKSRLQRMIKKAKQSSAAAPARSS